MNDKKQLLKSGLLAILGALLLNCSAYAQSLSDSSKISLLTCGSGSELYSVFGHSALRVHDPVKELDFVYNYGTFDFNTPNFYLKFAKGDLNYLLSIGRYKYFLPGYFAEERWVKEQELNLTLAERQKLFDALQFNARPENREYRYDFFFDNCATRLRDQVFNAVNGEVVLKDTIGQGLTYRQLYGNYLKQSPWVEFGIHLLLGAKADLKADAWHEMYLPDYLYWQFANSKISCSDGSVKPLVKQDETLLSFDETENAPSAVTPVMAFGLLFILTLVLSVWAYKSKRSLIAIDLVLLGVSGLASLLFVFLWFFTRHGVTANNFNLMWALPTNLVLAFLLTQKTPKFESFTKILTCISCAIVLIFVLSMQWLPQCFPNGLIFISLSLLIRFLFIIQQRGWGVKMNQKH